MVCHPCTDKWKQYYISKGFNEKQADFMAKKLVIRVTARQRKERNRIRYLRIKCLLYKWIFISNIKATILQSFLHRRLLWVGKGYNPDYNLACTGSCAAGTCDNFGDPCTSGVTCHAGALGCTMGTCGCPAPIAHSHQVSNSCTCNTPSSACIHCTVQVCIDSTHTCPCSGTCAYNCDTGYHLEGGQCVPTISAVTSYGDGLIWIVRLLHLRR